MKTDELFDLFQLLDGELIEIYAFDVDASAWDLMIGWLARTGRLESFTCEDVEIDRQVSLTAFDDPENWPYLLRARIGNTIWTSSLYDSANIDLQGDPREFSSIGDVETIIGFMKDLANLIGEPVTLISESSRPRETPPLHVESPNEQSIR